MAFSSFLFYEEKTASSQKFNWTNAEKYSILEDEYLSSSNTDNEFASAKN